MVVSDVGIDADLSGIEICGASNVRLGTWSTWEMDFISLGDLK